VYQDDLFYPTLTVREHLRFHAVVRMPASVARHEKNSKVGLSNYFSNGLCPNQAGGGSWVENEFGGGKGEGAERERPEA
jgi:hypothetical protein